MQLLEIKGYLDRRYLKMNVHEFLEYVAGSSIKVHQHEILEYLYEDHTVSTNRLYKIMKEKYKEELKISKKQFERYILNCQIKLEKTTCSFVMYFMNTSSGVL